MSQLYVHTEDIHNLSAPREVVPVVMDLVRPGSVLDVGCGTGTWLKVFEERGVADYVGVDGDYVDRSKLYISPDKFVAKDLRTPWSLKRKFDLVVSLEVAEHLAEKDADAFVKTLLDHGDTILFSAAIPGQGGQNHLNEQWPAYWQKKFEQHGFYFHDVVRPLIWENSSVHWWYRQNIFLIKKEKPAHKLQFSIHPECFAHQVKMLAEYNKVIVNGEAGISNSFNIFMRSVNKSLRKIFARS